ncbi:MAG: zinc ribbon domain-containing protein [Mariprofundaceae bacterium]|nr:zinc ribbon domain-containing protein [Mariprofundaceae bacterium]
MNCPKCGASQPDGAIECSHCGVIFEKYRKYMLSKGCREAEVRQRMASLPIRDIANPVCFYGRVGVLAVLVCFSWRLIPAPVAANAAGESFLHLINLPFHEAGHILFRPFGSLITSLGGSLGQLLMPAVCLVALRFRARDAFGAAVCLWWLGENFLDMAPYIDDARSLSMPLLGGNLGHSSPYGFHDWEFILTETGLLSYDHAIAAGAKYLGSFLMLGGMLWAAYLLLAQYRVLQQSAPPRFNRK